MNWLLAPFADDFMVRGFIAAVLVGVLCSAIGTFVILRKLAFIGDGIAHASFAGIVIAYLRAANFYVGAAVVAVITALAIGFVHRRGRVSMDTSIGVLFTGAFALGVFLMSRQRTYSVDLQDFLFGNILGVTRSDVWFIVALALLVGAALAWLYRPLVYTSFDPVVAQASGINAELVDYALLVLLALTIVVTLEAVGIVLVAALLVTPAATAFQLTRRFAPMMGIAALVGCLSSVGGLYLSYYLNAASGATIVLVATACFFVAIALRRLRVYAVSTRP
ncbi:MAG: manganese ABC transporter permease [Candidatus Meridianibacter frigidus]|nr:MAG: manganese ABC transporter permease [Candidatus Eremiobacteraeota bacterium]